MTKNDDFFAQKKFATTEKGEKEKHIFGNLLSTCLAIGAIQKNRGQIFGSFQRRQQCCWSHRGAKEEHQGQEGGAPEER